jgi:hypothetical protein
LHQVSLTESIIERIRVNLSSLFGVKASSSHSKPDVHQRIILVSNDLIREGFLTGSVPPTWTNPFADGGSVVYTKYSPEEIEGHLRQAEGELDLMRIE